LIFSKFKNTRIRVAAVIVEDGKILLIAHRKKRSVYWLLPGGGVDFGESLKEALQRELKEELNINVDVRDIAFVSDSIDPDNERHIVNICFFCMRRSGKLELGRDKRLYDYGFFSPNELNSIIVFPPFKEKLKKLCAGKDTSHTYIGKKWMNL